MLSCEQALNRQSRSVNAAPDNEGPVRSVPKPPEPHREHQVDVGPDFSQAIAAERDVKVIAQPGAQADVPPAPEILKAFCQIRLSKIDHEVETEKLRATAGNAAVTAKVSVYLPRE